MVAQYEQLRCDALSQEALPATGLGLALFLRQGMAAWIGAWSEWTKTCEAPSPSVVRIDTELPITIRSQLTFILASLLTHPMQEYIHERRSTSKGFC